MVMVSNGYRDFLTDLERHYKNLPRIASVKDTEDYKRRKKQPRNELCNCNSGKKFKKCCGEI